MKKFNLILLLIMAVITARYLAAGWERILKNTNSAGGDQAAYLQLGLDAREHGVITDGKRNPLYPLVLATFAHRHWAYFTWAKIFNFAVGLATLWALFLIGSRLFNPYAGLLAACLLSINFEFIAHTTFALAESLLFFTVLLAWFAMVRALQRPHQARLWLLAGVLTGLAYLAKGTGPLFATCFIATAVLLHSYRICFKRPFWAFITGLGLAALPLWLYNWAAFGSPLFNSAVNNVMWLDDASEKYVADASALPTFSSYLQEKSFGDIWARLLEGLLAMRYFYARLLWPTRSLTFDAYFERGWIDLLFITVLVLALIFWRPLAPVLKRHRESVLLIAILAAVFYLLFGWYIAISPFPIRFLLPLAPMLLLLLSAGAIGLGQALFSAPKMPRWAKAAAAVIMVAAIVRPAGWFAVSSYLIARGARQNAFTADAQFNDFSERPLRWTRAGYNGDRPVTVMWGPTHMLPVWKHTDRLNLIRTPVAQAGDINDLAAFMAASNVAYIIVDSEMVDRLGSEKAMEWGISAENGRIELSHYPSDWALGFVEPGLPCQYCVFRRLTAAPAIERVEYRLGEAIALFGYELDSSQFEPDGQLVVTLYWAALRPAAVDYTVFTQLLGPDYQLHGQMDGQPLAGRWPTSRWQPGQKFVDKFVLPVAPAAPPGEYTLLVGLYDGNTGRRLPAVAGGQRLHDDAIPLRLMTIPQAEANGQSTALEQE